MAQQNGGCGSADGDSNHAIGLYERIGHREIVWLRQGENLGGHHASKGGEGEIGREQKRPHQIGRRMTEKQA